jgi:hypothetical protein
VSARSFVINLPSIPGGAVELGYARHRAAERSRILPAFVPTGSDRLSPVRYGTQEEARP